MQSFSVAVTRVTPAAIGRDNYDSLEVKTTFEYSHYAGTSRWNWEYELQLFIAMTRLD